MFPVVAIWGHLWGLAITATTAIPEAVLTGFTFKIGTKVSLYFAGIAAIISTIFGTPSKPFLFAISFFS